MKIKKARENDFDRPPKSLEKVADANTVIGEPIITVSGSQVIPLSTVTVVSLNGGGEYGDVRTFKISEGFKIAGANGTVITVRPRGFLVDDGSGCKLLRMEESAIDTIIEKTGDLVNTIHENV